MGFFSIFKKKSSSTPRSSAQRRSSARRSSSSASKMTTTQKVVAGAWGVARAAGKQVRQTARNVKANVDYAANHQERNWPIEKKGYERLGTYKPDSRDLKWAIARYQRDGYTLAMAKSVNGYGEPNVLLWGKYSRNATKSRKILRVAGKKAAKKGRSRAPEFLSVEGKRFRKGGTFGDSKADAMRFAKSLKAEHGLQTRVRKISILDQSVYAVYYRKGVKKAKRTY